MKRIVWVPIEPLEERYSANWARWYPKEFKDARVPFIEIMPAPLSDKIRDGAFLDVCGTNYFKAMQIAELCKMAYNKELTDNDVIFLGDVWFPGLEALAYIRDCLKMKFKIVGCLFAGTYDPNDFLTKNGVGYWGKHQEEAWFRIIDKFFMATKDHCRMVRDTRDIDPKKLIVTGHPVYYAEDRNTIEKENIVVFPHRLNEEKNPDMFTALKFVLQDIYPNWEFLFTKKETTTKQEYFDLLERAKISVSYADQETYGFAMVESIAARCFPVVPDILCYKEMYHPVFRFKSFNESVVLVKSLIEKPIDFYEVMLENRKRLLDDAASAIPKMIHECMNWD